MAIQTRRIALFLFCIAVWGSPLNAQVCGTVVPGEKQGLDPRGYAPSSNTMNAEDRRVIERVISAAEQLVLQTVYGKPRGYYAFTHAVFDAPPSRTHLSAYQIAYVMFCPTRRAVGGDGTGGVTFVYNPSPQLWSEGDRPMRDERGDGIYTERVRKPAQLGATLTFGDFDDVQDLGLSLLFTAGGESPTIPVTREEFLRALIFTVEGPSPKKSPYQEWLDQAPDRLKIRNDIVAMVKDPVKAAQLRADLEKKEREQTEAMRQSAESPSLAAPYRAKLAALSPAERAMPAFVIGDDFVAPNSPNAHAVVRENPAFYRPRRSPVEPRAVLVRIPQRTYKELEAERRQMFREFDWAALKRTVSP